MFYFGPWDKIKHKILRVKHIWKKLISQTRLINSDFIDG